MATRYNAKPKTTFGVPPIKTGYNRTDKPDLTIPPVGIADADRSLFKLFDEEIPLQVETPDGIKKVPIVFSAGEKWAMLKKGAPRDKTGSLILPIICVGRTTIAQTPGEDISGRGINQQTGEIVIKRRLDDSNRSYQNLANRLYIKNQQNVAVNSTDPTVTDQVTSNRNIGELKDDPIVRRGGLLASRKKYNNVWETIVMPAPQFYTATYEVIVWTQYIQQMNSIIENIVSSFLPQGNQWKLETEHGYWFIATVDTNLYNSQNNFDDMSQTERMIKYQFSIKVPGYILGSGAPGVPVPIKRYISNPEISFNVSTESNENGEPNPWLGSDDPTLPHTPTNNKRLDQRDVGKTRLYPGTGKTSPHDPALSTYDRTQPNVGRYKKVVGMDGKGNPVVKYVKIKTINKHSGETVYSSSTDLGGISITTIKD